MVELDELKVLIYLTNGNCLTKGVILQTFLSGESYNKLKEEKYIKEVEPDGDKRTEVQLDVKGDKLLNKIKSISDLEKISWLISIGFGEVTERKIKLYLPRESTLYKELYNEKYIIKNGLNDFGGVLLRLADKGKEIIDRIKEII